MNFSSMHYSAHLPPFAEILILVLILGLAFKIKLQDKSMRALFLRLYIIGIALALLFAPVFLTVSYIICPLLIYPVYSCWLKPTNQKLWRCFASVSFIVAIGSPNWVLFDVRSFEDIFVQLFLLPHSIMLVVQIISIYDWQKRKQKIDELGY